MRCCSTSSRISGNPHPRANCGCRQMEIKEPPKTGNPHPRANCGEFRFSNGRSLWLAIHTHARIAGLATAYRAMARPWQSTPTRELRACGSMCHRPVARSGNPHPRANCGGSPAGHDRYLRLAIHTHARIAGGFGEFKDLWDSAGNPHPRANCGLIPRAFSP